jgi:uridylate kinase
MATRARVAISVGGSIAAPEDLDTTLLRALARVLREASRRRDLLVVVGGGRLSRMYIAAARELGADEGSLDWVGIDATRLNARLVIAALGDAAYHDVPHDFGEALTAARSFHVVVMGGTHPGHTTDAVTAMLAEVARATEIVILTNVDGVYSADPKVDASAHRLPRISASKLTDIVGSQSAAAGSPGVVDPMAARIIQRSRIPTKVLDGRDLEGVRAALGGRAFKGTLVVPDAKGRTRRARK